MEDLNDLRSGKRQTSEDIDKKCILHQLNVNCHLELLQYLSVEDLLQVCKLDPYFEELITKWIIGKKIVKLVLLNPSDKFEIIRLASRKLVNKEVANPGDTFELFKAFGKSIRKLEVSAWDFNYILGNVTKYCTPARLTEVHIMIHSASLNVNLIHLSMPYFTNLQKLRLEYQFHSASFKTYLEEVADNAVNLKILQVKGDNIQGEWLQTKSMQKLCELKLETSENISIEDLTTFLQRHPKLEEFSFSGKEDITTIGMILSKYCCDLKKFSFEFISNTAIDSNIVSTNRYNFLSRFLNLESVTLTSFESLLYLPMIQKSKHTVKELKVYLYLDSFKDECKVKHLVNSRVMEIELQKFSTNESERRSCNLSYEYILELVSHIKNLDNITLVCTRKLANFNGILERILELSPKLRTLSISGLNFMHLPVEIWKIVRVLRKVWKERKNGKHLFNLVTTEEQWREFRVYDDVKRIITTTISIDRNSSRREGFH